MKKALIFLVVSIGIAIISFVGLRFYLAYKAILEYNRYIEQTTSTEFVFQ